MVDAYPLAWPDGWPRTPDHLRPIGRGQFMRGSWNGGISTRRAWTLAEARDELLAELKRLKADSIVVSSNFRPGRDGVLVEGKRRPDDQGVAVYFRRNREAYVMAYDEWKDAESNFRSLALSIDALRQLERHGGGTMLKRAFGGFVALPAPKQPHEILGVSADSGEAAVRAAWRSAVADAHPDRGGSEARTAELNAARDDMLKRLRS